MPHVRPTFKLHRSFTLTQRCHFSLDSDSEPQYL